MAFVRRTHSRRSLLTAYSGVYFTQGRSCTRPFITTFPALLRQRALRSLNRPRSSYRFWVTIVDFGCLLLILGLCCCLWISIVDFGPLLLTISVYGWLWVCIVGFTLLNLYFYCWLLISLGPYYWLRVAYMSHIDYAFIFVSIIDIVGLILTYGLRCCIKTFILVHGPLILISSVQNHFHSP